jgi:DNA-binding transcriptional regulator YiaG
MDMAEKQKIGSRLREFREGLQIPRARFAVTIGFGGERIASYEAGRAQLPYAVFLAVRKRYLISPHWLATGNLPRKWPNSYDYICDVDFKPRQSFSEVYRHLLSSKINPAISTVLLNQPESFRESVENDLHQLEAIDLVSLAPDEKRRIENEIRVAKQMLDGKNISFPHLTVSSEIRNMSGDMKLPRTMEQLLAEVRRLTEPAGMKSALAKYLVVPQARVSEWLAEKYKPSGKVTLKLMHWVSDPRERQK